MPLRVAVVVDDELMRRGLASTLDEDPMIDVVIEAPAGPVQVEGVDVAVVSWPTLSDHKVRCPQVVLAPPQGSHSIPRRVEFAAVLPREGLTAEQIVVAVRAAAAGLRVDADVEDPPTDDALDARQLAVLRLLAEGADTRTIATKLRYSERTVKTLIHDVELTLGARSRAQAVAEAFRLGLI